MFLDARAANCWASTFILKADGHAVGKFETRFFSEGLDIALIGRRQLRLERVGWLGCKFILKREGDEEPIIRADRSGILSSGWDLELQCGGARLVRAGWFQTSYLIQQGTEMRGQVDRLGWCQQGWQVEAYGLTLEKMILVGLIYHIIMRRQSQHAAAAGGHAGT
jgi:hypothetical protein